MRVGVIIISVVVVAVAVIGAYQYAAEQTRQQGFAFGNDLQQIQDDIKELQTRFYSSITSWEEGDITRDELASNLQAHLESFQSMIQRYDSLDPPQGFAGAVELFRLSSRAQMESDTQYVEWLRTGQDSAKTRSDLQLKESFDLEMAALAEYNKARAGVP